jgi:hypothetical protein
MLALLSLACAHPPSPAPAPAPATAAGTFREYVLTDASACAAARYTCASQQGFSDATGCGCVSPRRSAADTMCTMDLTPVCATLADGSRQTASNACIASTLPTVTETRPAACP